MDSDGRDIEPANGRQADKTSQLIVAALGSFGRKSWALSKSATAASIAMTRKYLADRRAAAEQAKQDAQKARFRDTFQELSNRRNLINPASWQAVEKYAASVQEDAEALGRFADHELVKNLVEYSKARETFVQRDLARQRRTHVFEVDCDRLFSGIHYSLVNPILKGIVKSYRVSNAGNVVASGMSGAYRSVGGVASSMVQAARVGAHNGDASAAFLNHIVHLAYVRPAADLSDLHQRYIVYAHRLLFLNTGDKQTVSRALFSLVYDNGNAVPRAPTPRNKFSGCLHPEFHNNFRSYIWTVNQAAVHLDEIRKSGQLAASLFEQDDIVPFLRRWKDEVPQPGFHLSA